MKKDQKGGEEAASSPWITSDSSFLPSSSFTLSERSLLKAAASGHSMNFELYRATTPATGLYIMYIFHTKPKIIKKNRRDEHTHIYDIYDI